MSVSGKNIGVLLLQTFSGIAAILAVGAAIDAIDSSPDGWKMVLAVVLVIVLPVAFGIAFLVYVWPTLWRYERVSNGVVRIRRFDGRAEALTPTGWVSLTDVDRRPSRTPD